MSVDSLQVTENASAAVATAPRITKKFIEDNIAAVIYALGSDIVEINDQDAPHGYAHLTICIIRFHNGWLSLGKSAPMSPENFNKELGRSLAYEDAFRQAWALYAFAQLEENFQVEEAAVEAATSNARNNDGESPSPNSAESKPAE